MHPNFSQETSRTEKGMWVRRAYMMYTSLSFFIKYKNLLANFYYVCTYIISIIYVKFYFKVTIYVYV